ncbi:MAG: hypothetical protein JWR60_2839 [Polaromonas sp.]|nr:hypothetical protein [Polaromonas sp.]
MVNYFWDERAMEKAGKYPPTMLAIGDSWFWYAFVGGSLVNNIGDIVESKNHKILAKGMNGAEAYDFVDGKYAGIVNHALKKFGSGLSAVFISAGGNDFAGFNDLRPLLKPECQNETTAAGCFRDGQDGLADFMSGIDLHYRKLIGLAYTHTVPGCKIVMHTYDYAIPTGKGIFGGAGWLKPALQAAGVPDNLHHACVKHLLDAFQQVLNAIAAMDPLNLLVVDSRNTLAPHEWANELHPSSAGFKKIAWQCWHPVLKRVNLAN